MAARRKTRRRSAAKRELISPRGDKRYIRRSSSGRIKESDEQSRSLSSDRRRKAKKSAKAGQGDKGDRRTASKRRGKGASRGKSASRGKRTKR